MAPFRSHPHAVDRAHLPAMWILTVTLMLTSTTAFANKKPATAASPAPVFEPPPAADPPAEAPASPPPTYNTAAPVRPLHSGFWYRGGIGPAYVSASTRYQDVDIRASGLGLTAGSQVGWALASQLILHLDFDVTYVIQPSITASAKASDGTTVSVTQDSKGNLIPILLGMGMTGYFWGGNAFLSGTAGVTGLELGSLDTGAGFGINILLGAEGETRAARFMGGALKASVIGNPSRNKGYDAWVYTATIGLIFHAGGY